MELSSIVHVLRRWWLVLLLALLAGTIAGHRSASNRDDVYETETALLVGPFNADSDTLRAAGQLAQTYAELATRADILEEAVARIAPEIDPEDVTVEAVANEVTRVLTVQVRSGDAVVTKGVAAALAHDLVALGDIPVPVSPDDLVVGEPVPPAQVRPEGRMTVVQEARLPEGPVSHRVPLTAALAGLAGLLAALGPILLHEHRNQAVHDVDDLAVPEGGVLAVLGARRPLGRRGSLAHRLVVEAMPRSDTAHSFRVAATDVEAAVRHRGGERSIVVTGTEPGDGTGDVAANLAAALVHSGLRVTLVDQDADAAEITAIADHPRDPVTYALRRGPGLTVVPYAELLAERDVAEARAWLEGRLVDSDAVVLHAPALRGSAMSLLWAAAADAAVVVARRDLTRRDQVDESLDRLRRVHADLLGVLLDTRRPRRLNALRQRWLGGSSHLPRQAPLGGEPGAPSPPTPAQETSEGTGPSVAR